ncbi:hypothetical protein FNE59_14415 [Bacillus thuringiensis]|uniref:YiiX/YebB-like N1pC/P60 family cysteine hydrolase n=1 Tax=Bacillus cereus group TaxID=86661 RepID=UPI0013FA320D|nr:MULTISPECIES: YiiX/YebB-like N1pC/P60 family cysteine hydrolase [Bacillus cereus group]MBJ7935647.1 hypothetical protein [Bacillus cereus]MDR5046740.1 hypothetical protein [Bacillus thuringiensis]MEB9420045.1 YiiX/YebB-like N1pC/P60 family cysteine hydrolase [Bacillus cereus]MRD18424.1 hypothetical protein [Bacillus thuringiensis]
MKLQTGDIVLVKGNTPIISRLIRWVTSSDYTHVGMIIADDLILEIDINKDLAIRPMKHEVYDIYRYTKGLTSEQRTKIIKQSIRRAKLNKGYDWRHIISFALQKLFRTSRVFEEANKVVCSEIVDNIYNDIGIDLIPNCEDGDVTPGQLAASPYLTKLFSCKQAA